MRDTTKCSIPKLLIINKKICLELKDCRGCALMEIHMDSHENNWKFSPDLYMLNNVYFILNLSGSLYTGNNVLPRVSTLQVFTSYTLRC